MKIQSYSSTNLIFSTDNQKRPMIKQICKTIGIVSGKKICATSTSGKAILNLLLSYLLIQFYKDFDTEIQKQKRFMHNYSKNWH